jgi:hypothetical protein
MPYRATTPPASSTIRSNAPFEVRATSDGCSHEMDCAMKRRIPAFFAAASRLRVPSSRILRLREP